MMKKKPYKIIFLLGILGIATFLINYHIPKHVSKTYHGLEYRDNYHKPVSIQLDVTVNKSLISKTKIDGILRIDGKSTEISNHLVFKKEGDGKISTTDSRNILKIIKDELNSNLYRLDRSIAEIIDGMPKMEIELIIDTSKDFKYIYISTFKNNYIAPAQNLDEVKKVSNILFFKK